MYKHEYHYTTAKAFHSGPQYQQLAADVASISSDADGTHTTGDSSQLDAKCDQQSVIIVDCRLHGPL